RLTVFHSICYLVSHHYLVSLSMRPRLIFPLFPYTTLFRSIREKPGCFSRECKKRAEILPASSFYTSLKEHFNSARIRVLGELKRSEEHTSELQSHLNLVCRLLLEQKKIRAVA